MLEQSKPDPFFFGYGSLVNRATHDYELARPARVIGWRRKWRHTSLRDVAYLTVQEAPGHRIDGLIAAVPNADWAALDIREKAYDRLHLPDRHVDHDHPDNISVQIYKTKPGNDAPPTVLHPILLSYLDTVIHGYLDVFGEQGVHDFFDSTDGWDSPIHNDRDAPIYPRHSAPKDDILGFIDEKLNTVAANVKQDQPYRRW
jgi:gamma-glutamyl AIG2-like cyclotransferase